MVKNPKKNRNIRDTIVITVILLIALFLRLYKINTPLADFHSWRQVDTASVARTFTREGFNLLVPRYHDLSNVPSTVENPRGYRMVEFPLYNASFAALYTVFPALPLEVWGRLVSIFASLVVTACIYYLVKKEADAGAAALAAAIFAILPFSVFFSRVVLPEMSALALTFTSIVLLHRMADTTYTIRRWIYVAVSSLLFATALLVKPTTIFFSVSMVYLFFRAYDIHAFKSLVPYLYFIVSAVPLYLWRQHIQQYPEGIPLNAWLITSVNTYQGQERIFFRPAFFRWIFYERINNMILGGYLSVFFILGTIAKQRKYFLHSILISSLLYLLVFQGGNVQHEYYQVLITPAIAIFTGAGLGFLYQKRRSLVWPLISLPLIFIICLFALFISYYRIKDYYNYATDLTTISTIIKSITKPDDKIVTDSTGDTTLLYLADRKGSASVYKDLPELVKSGYEYFITQNGQVIQATKDQYPQFSVAFENDKVAIFKLQ